MRAPNPLREILESTLRHEEPMLDTEWPAADVLLLPPDAEARPRSDASFMRPVGPVRR